MKMYVCAVLDRKVNAYLNPQFFRTKGEGTRAFMDLIHRDTNLRTHAEDYIFVYLGRYDDSDGRFENCPGGVPEILMTALDCVQIEQAPS